MRVIVYGVGAIGGAMAVALTEAGTEVIGIARGKQLEAIKADGLTLRTPDGDKHQRFAAVGHPNEIDWRPDDAVLLTVKTQDTLGALQALRAAGVAEQPIFCVQNGIANDDMALRLFPHVYGVMIEMPVTYATPGEVIAYYSPKPGLVHIGRHGAGDDKAGQTLKALLEKAGFAAFVQPDLRPLRYAKLLMNLANAVDAVMGGGEPAKPYVEAARAEAREVYYKAGIAPGDLVAASNGLRLTLGKVPGAPAGGSSSAQSLARGAGSIETDYLNGEIVLMGRKLGVPTPVNAWFANRAQAMVRQGEAARSVDIAEIRAALPHLA